MADQGRSPTKSSPMKRIFIASILLLALFAPTLNAQDDKPKKRRGLEGPAAAQLGSVAEIQVPVGHVFFDGKTTREMMEASGEPVGGNEVGFLSPTNRGWAVYFQFDESGYVKDDDKDKLDADKLLKSIKEGNDEGNKYRKEHGNPTLDIVGWDQKPAYDATTHNLTWAIRAESKGEQIVNYNTRLLGRKGVMEVVLVCDPADLPKHLPDFNALLEGYKYSTGETYAEYKPGDKIAKYGLGALVLGGAAVGAAKLGLFAWLGVFLKKGFKLVIVAIVAIVAGFKKFISRFFNKNRDN
ncbi:MAG: DUF2167 domain-containing protein [Verrucomicrobia bacterium]|jgi:uncharacterized membrane-anchored protein|nr:MAG: DUF2167 domain-containing protein [Verrucomicrobiota bacterium]